MLLPAVPGGTQPPVAWQSARQFAGILPASHPLPPLVKYGVEKTRKKESKNITEMAGHFSTRL